MAPALTSGPVHRPFRFGLIRLCMAVLVRCILRIRVEGRENLATGPAIYCANHLNWTDPLILLAVLPGRPKFAMFGPKEADMTKGGRNRLITWAGFGVPYRPEKTDLLETTRRVQQVLRDGWIIVIFGEGRIHRGERELLPLADGTAYFALRAGVPVVPIAINGTSWLGFGRSVRIRIGEAIPADGRANREGVAQLTARTTDALRRMTSDFPDRPTPGPFGRWLTEVFNDWPEGSRPELPADIAPTRDVSAAPEPSPVWHPASRPLNPQEDPWERPASPPTRTSTAPDSASSRMPRSTRGPRS